MKHVLLSSIMIGSATISICGQKPDNKPNIILIMCDDMGFSDLGCYGSEIRTPNIDRLANHGVRFSQFTNTGRSCPSRAALVTGRYQHEVGMGWMTAVDEHRPGYRGQISNDYPTIAEILKANGYSTYMSGKWHLTLDQSYGKPNGSMPTQRGFERFYGCLSGGGSYYKPKPLYNNMDSIGLKEIPDDYYYTTAITDSATSFILQHDTQKPLFLYVAYYAPHLPLQAPEDRVARCRPYYNDGYDVLRNRRLDRQKQLGLFPDTAQLPIYEYEFNGKRPNWDELSKQQQENWINNMATYAAMIEIVDDGIGELIEALKQKNMLDNSIILFLSDNGSTSETGLTKQLMADLSNTPYRCYKSWCLNGGIYSPLIISCGNVESHNANSGKWTAQRSHIIDILPTCMEIAKARYPSEVYNHPDLPGMSLANVINNTESDIPRTLYYEHQSSCAIIDKNMKLVRYDNNTPWKLYNLATDPFEQHDLSSKEPDVKKQLEDKWNNWAKSCNVFPLENIPWNERIKHYTDLNPDQSGTK